MNGEDWCPLERQFTSSLYASVFLSGLKTCNNGYAASLTEFLSCSTSKSLFGLSFGTLQPHNLLQISSVVCDLGFVLLWY